MLVHFPTPYPDELLYSTCARYGDIMQYRSKGHLCKDLFGILFKHYSADLPKYLNRLIASFPTGHRYTADYLINHHTLLPFYAPFLPLKYFQSLVETMMTGKVHRNQRSNQIRHHSNNSKSSSRLNFCPSCVSEDRAIHGECYWHRIHQIPGVSVCPTHGDFLDESNVLVIDSRLNNLFISAETARIKNSVQSNELKPYHHILMKIAQDAQWLLECDKICKLPEIRSRYLYLLAEERLASYSSIVQSKRLLEMFQNYYTSDFLRAIGFELDFTNPHNWLIRLVNRHGQKKFQNPLGHLLLINFLGYSVQEFFELPPEPKYLGEASWPCLNPVCKFYKSLCIDSLKISKHTRSSLPVGTFKCVCGFTYKRVGPDQTEQDKFRYNYVTAYGHVWEEELKRLLEDKALPLNQIAKKLGVSKDIIYTQARKLGFEMRRKKKPNNGPDFETKRSQYREQWLNIMNTYQQLGFWKLAAKFSGVHTWLYRHDSDWLASTRPLSKNKIKKATYRKEFLEVRGLFPDAGRTELRLDIVPAQYTWLYKYDREWLLENLPAEKPKHKSPKKKLGGLDEQIEKEVRECAAKMRNSNERPQRITKTAIGKDIGRLSLFRNSLRKLPLTSQAINEVVETYEEVAVRRIWWAANDFVREKDVPSKSELIRKACVQKLLISSEIKVAIDEAIEFIYKNV